MANFGIGLGAFTQGFANGLQMGKTIDSIRANNAKQEAWKQAQTEYNSQVDSTAADMALTQAGQADPNQPFDAGAAAKAARPAAQQKVGSFVDFVLNKQLPKIVDTYMANGDVKGAQALMEWGKSDQAKRNTEMFGSALNDFYAGASDGNYTPFADKAVKLLNNSGHGAKATGYDFIKDDGGKTTGITFHIEEGDQKYDRTFNSMQDVGQFLAGQADPRSQATLFQKRAADASKFKATIATKKAEAQIGLAKDTALEDTKQANRLQLEAAKSKQDGSKVQRDFEYMSGVLKQNGFSDDEIKAYIPAMLKIGQDRKGISPQEYAQQLTKIVAQDWTMRDKSPQEIAQKVNTLMQIAQKAGQSAQPAAPVSPAQQPGIIGGSVPVYTGQ